MSGSKKEAAPCREACPAGIDVPRYVRHIRKGDFNGALAVIREKIPFPAVCGHACVHPCESTCARIQYDESIAIRMLKRAADELSTGLLEYERKTDPSGRRVAVIGSGPCGLTAAYYLAVMGHGVTVFEALPQAGGMLRYGIPEYRLPKAVVDREIAMIGRCGVDIITSSPVRSALELRKKGYDAVLVATGAWKPLKMGIDGEEPSRVLEAIALLREINTGERKTIGKKVVVVGGGNSAIDAARAGVRLGAKVTLVYRRGRQDMPASPGEVAEAEEEGIRMEFMAAPVRILKRKVVCVRMSPGPLDGSGRPTPVPIEGSTFFLACDDVVMAVGQRADAESLDLKGNPNGTVKIGSNSATATRGIFAAGDAVTGPSTIIDAIAQGRLACASIDRYLGGTGKIDRELLPQDSDALPEASPMGSRRPATVMLSPKRRIQGFDPIESGYIEAAAVAEAERCLACDLRHYTVEVNPVICKECGYCREMCRMNIFTTSDSFNASGYKPSVVTRSDRCVGCLKCLYVCPDFAITVKEGRWDQGGGKRAPVSQRPSRDRSFGE